MAYGQAFRLGAIRGIVDKVLHDAQHVIAAKASLLLDVEQLENTIREGLESDFENGSFLYYEFLLPFLNQARGGLDRFITSARGRFAAKIAAIVADDGPLPKRYPLHEPERQIQVRIPMRNSGPGLAISVRATVSTQSDGVVLQGVTVLLGDVQPGDFSLTFDVLILTPLSSFSADVQVEWGQIGVNERDADIFSFLVLAQASDIDWAALEYWHPYSTDPAEGERFIGRAEVVNNLASRLLRSPMEPIYITGQKRIGKTSLSLATVEFARAHAPKESLQSTNILWGRIAHADAKATMAEFGRHIEDFIFDHLPPQTPRRAYSYEGTLTPLMRISELARNTVPEKRFIVIIDEFDEIHQDLYLQGSLAETFFANLRALTTTKNLCLVLVGGENMPFIMERQGEKLNKFTRQSLSYFSRATEWEDFMQLVRRPSAGVIRWSDDAISAIFNETNGNPYFTNLLCSRILREAVRSRDADVTSDEVANALNAELFSLDANSFAHLWHDGILKPIQERESLILFGVVGFLSHWQDAQGSGRP